MKIRLLLACLGAFVLPQIAHASPAVTLDSATFVEHVDSQNTRSLERANNLHRGDRVVYIVTWYKMGGQGDFTITNPLPRTVSYQASADGDEQVSVDGGRTWGQLGDLRVGERLATPEDVTHVRWKVTESRSRNGSGRIAYSAIVR